MFAKCFFLKEIFLRIVQKLSQSETMNLLKTNRGADTLSLHHFKTESMQIQI